MRTPVALMLLFGAAVLCGLVALAQESRPREQTVARITVHGAGLEELKLDAAELVKLPRVTIKVRDHDGAESTFEGVRVGDILKKAGLTFGQNLRGPRLADYLLVTSGDGFRVVFALAELDSAFSDRVVLLADRCDGQPLPERDGPLRVIVSDEHRHARWVRNPVEFNVLSAPASK